MTVESLKPNKTTRVACLNVRTLYQTSKLAQVVKEFDNYNLDILGCHKMDGSRKEVSIRPHYTLFRKTR